MEKILRMRDICVRGVVKEFEKAGVVVSEFNGNYFASADVAVNECDGSNMYRIVVVRHNKKTVLR